MEQFSLGAAWLQEKVSDPQTALEYAIAIIAENIGVGKAYVRLLLLPVHKVLRVAIIIRSARLDFYEDYQIVLIGNDVGLQLAYTPVGFQYQIAILLQILPRDSLAKCT